MNTHLIDLQARSLRLSEQHGKRSDIARKTHLKLCEAVNVDLAEASRKSKPVHRVPAVSERRV